MAFPENPYTTTPDPSTPLTGGAAVGDVLTLDTNKLPTWAVPSGGGGGGLAESPVAYLRSTGQDLSDNTPINWDNASASNFTKAGDEISLDPDDKTQVTLTAGVYLMRADVTFNPAVSPDILTFSADFSSFVGGGTNNLNFQSAAVAALKSTADYTFMVVVGEDSAGTFSVSLDGAGIDITSALSKIYITKIGSFLS